MLGDLGCHRSRCGEDQAHGEMGGTVQDSSRESGAIQLKGGNSHEHEDREYQVRQYCHDHSCGQVGMAANDTRPDELGHTGLLLGTRVTNNDQDTHDPDENEDEPEHLMGKHGPGVVVGQISGGPCHCQAGWGIHRRGYRFSRLVSRVQLRQAGGDGQSPDHQAADPQEQPDSVQT